MGLGYLHRLICQPGELIHCGRVLAGRNVATRPGATNSGKKEGRKLENASESITDVSSPKFRESTRRKAEAVVEGSGTQTGAGRFRVEAQVMSNRSKMLEG